MSRLVQFTAPEADCACYEETYNGALADLLTQHIAAVCKSHREQKLREGVRIALELKQSMPAEADLDAFVTAGKATIQANLEAARLAAAGF